MREGKNNIHRTGNTGTLEYIAPELLKTDSYGNYDINFVSESVDIWSLGIFFFLFFLLFF
jgi:serine/threonine protein kinase